MLAVRTKRILTVIPLAGVMILAAAFFLLRRECGRYNFGWTSGDAGTPPKYCVCKSTTPQTAGREGRGAGLSYPARYCGFMMSPEQILRGYYRSVAPAS